MGKNYYYYQLSVTIITDLIIHFVVLYSARMLFLPVLLSSYAAAGVHLWMKEAKHSRHSKHIWQPLNTQSVHERSHESILPPPSSWPTEHDLWQATSTGWKRHGRIFFAWIYLAVASVLFRSTRYNIQGYKVQQSLFLRPLIAIDFA
jgi:hypothetical protein